MTNPGTLFRVLSPFVQLSLLLALIVTWKPAGPTRWYLAAALLLAVTGDIITFTFHYPRNVILFQSPLTNSSADFERTASEWAAGNYVRIAVVLTAVILTVISLVRVARQTVQPAFLTRQVRGV